LRILRKINSGGVLILSLYEKYENTCSEKKISDTRKLITTLKNIKAIFSFYLHRQKYKKIVKKKRVSVKIDKNK